MAICPSYFPHVIVVFMLLRNKRSHQKTSCHNVLLYHTAEAHAMTFLYTAGFQGFPRVLKGVQGTNTWSWLRGKVKQLPESTASRSHAILPWLIQFIDTRKYGKCHNTSVCSSALLTLEPLARKSRHMVTLKRTVRPFYVAAPVIWCNQWLILESSMSTMVQYIIPCSILE